MDRQVRGDANQVALSPRDRIAGCGAGVDWLLKVNGTNDIVEAFGIRVTE